MSIVKKYKSRIFSIESKIAGVYTLEIGSQNRPFKYYPGQFLHLALDSDYDGAGQWPESRCFSMQSNPEEENIRITYAVKGRFTRMMEESLRRGSEVWLKLPFGNLFISPHNKKYTVFIAGGTGITPFLSLFTHHSFNEYISPHIYLGFRSGKHNIYREELKRLHNSTCEVKYIYEDIDGQINIQEIYNENRDKSDYFISGPPDMIKSFKRQLMNNGISPRNLLTDEWE